ncbi:MAG: hypothetical protein EOP47_09065 [Sphingobacteriaceae bacterium]|nr:MAG: hypothetical protein EOP47_09065 [Sphingobacteriaceae bacterium]
MSAKKPNISQIDKYLKGKLDARAMHQLERQAQDDPFLMDALEGYESSQKDQQKNISDLKEQLARRTAPAKQRSLILWRILPIAATVLLMLGAGYWFLKSPEPAKDKYVYKVTGDNHLTPPPPTGEKQTIVDPKESKLAEKKTYKSDPNEYIADNHSVRANATVDDILKKIEGVEVSPDGSIAFQGQPVTGAKLNGKDFAGGDVAAAVKNLPADIVEKLQFIDDYGDQAARTGVRDGNPAKILNITTDTAKQDLIAINRAAPMLREVAVIAPEKPLSERTVAGKVLDQKGEPLIGATVKIDGTGTGVATDVNGNFKIDLPANKDLIAVNYVGYNTQQVKVRSQDNLNISLKPVDNSLSEVAVAGFGIAKKTKAMDTACKENLKFKTQFFNHIATVEKYVNEHARAAKFTIKDRAFKNSLQFLSKHTKVSADEKPNGVNYFGLQTLKSYKDQWLKWYEDNKCSNLK